jgi:glycine/serine hydroxymethyltransferase
MHLMEAIDTLFTLAHENMFRAYPLLVNHNAKGLPVSVLSRYLRLISNILYNHLIILKRLGLI